MAGIPLQDVNRAIATSPVPWAKKTLVIKRASFPKGAIPPHLRSYTERFKEAVRHCAPQIKKGQGAATVQGFNACISAQLGGR